MGNQCCGNPNDEGTNEVNNSNGKTAIKQNQSEINEMRLASGNAHESTYRSGNVIEPIREEEVETKYDYQVGEGATYTG